MFPCHALRFLDCPYLFTGIFGVKIVKQKKGKRRGCSSIEEAIGCCVVALDMAMRMKANPCLLYTSPRGR